MTGVVYFSFSSNGGELYQHNTGRPPYPRRLGGLEPACPFFADLPSALLVAPFVVTTVFLARNQPMQGPGGVGAQKFEGIVLPDSAKF